MDPTARLGVGQPFDLAEGDREADTDACLRARGWAYGSLALRRMELRVGHPNGLTRVCFEAFQHEEKGATHA